MRHIEKIRAVLVGIACAGMCVNGACGIPGQAEETGQTTESEQKMGQNVESYVFDNALERTYMENGILYYQNDHLYYCDAESGENLMLCGDSACKHERPSEANPNPSCGAVLNGAFRNSFAIIGDKLYFSFGEEGEEFTGKSFFEASLDGRNRKEIAHIDAEQISQTFYNDTELYVAYLNTMDTTNTDAIALDELDQWKAGIKVISLSDGSVEDLVEEESRQGEISELSVQGTMVYYVYQEYGISKVTIHLCSYDRKSGKKNSIKTVENGVCGGIFGQKNMIYITKEEKENVMWNYNFQTKEEQKIAIIGNLDNVYKIGEKYIYSDWTDEFDHKKYSLVDKNGKVELIREVEKNAPIILAVVSDKVYLEQYDERRKDTNVSVMNTEDFLSGNWEKCRILFWPNETTGSGAEKNEE